MIEHADLIKQVVDGVVNAVASLPRPIFTAPLRCALALGAAILASAWTFSLGSRSASLQISVACLAGFSAVLVPVEYLHGWLRGCGETLYAFLFGTALLLTAVLPALVPYFLVPKQDTQRLISKFLYAAVGGVLILNLLVTAIRQTNS